MYKFMIKNNYEITIRESTGIITEKILFTMKFYPTIYQIFGLVFKILMFKNH